MKKLICLILFTISLPAFAQTQTSDCTESEYRQLLSDAQTARRKGEYDLAINKYFSAKVCRPDNAPALDNKILEIFTEVNEQRTRAIRNEQEARRQRDIAEANLAKANRLIYHLNFGAEPAAWAFKNGAFAVINLNGDTLTDFIYKDPEAFQNGTAVCRESNQYLIVDANGRVISDRYDYLLPTTHNRLLGGKGGIQLLLDRRGVVLFQPGESRRQDGFQFVIADDLFGLLDASDRLIVPPGYEYISLFNGNYAQVRNNGLFGFINKNGREVIPCQYDRANPFINGQAVVLQNDRWGTIDTLGQTVLPFEYERLDITGYGGVFVKNGDWGVISRNGQLIPTPDYDQIYPFDAVITPVTVGEQWGLIDSDGQVIASPLYEAVGNYNDRFALLKLNGQWGVLSSRGQGIIPFEFDSILSSFDQFIPVMKAGKWGLYHENGQALIPPKFDFLSPYAEGVFYAGVDETHFFCDSLGQLLVELKGSRLLENTGPFAMVSKGMGWQLIDPTGELQPDTTAFELIYGYTEGMAPFQLEEKWGYLDTNGQIAIPPVFTTAEFFIDGYALVAQNGQKDYIDRTGQRAELQRFGYIGPAENGRALVNTSEYFQFGNTIMAGGKWGIADSAGRLLAPAIYDRLAPFSSQYYLAQAGESWWLLDRQGQPAKLLPYETVEVPENGMALVTRAGLSGAIDTTGAEMIDPRYEVLNYFSEGWAGFQAGGRAGFVNTSGRELPQRFEEVASFREGLAPVQQNMLWGFSDTSGRVVIPCVYDFVQFFSEGVAWVKQNGMFRLIDRDGQPALPTSYTDARLFLNGQASVKKPDGLWGCIDRSGREVTAFQFDKMFAMPGGPTIVKKADLYGLMDTTGQLLVPVAYRFVQLAGPGLYILEQGDNSGLCDDRGQLLLPVEYEKIGRVENGRIMVRKAGLLGFCDTLGRELLPCAYNAIYPAGPHLYQTEQNGRVGLYAPVRGIQLPCNYEKIGYLDEENGLIRLKQGGLWGWAAWERGQVVSKIPFRFDASSPFRNGRARVVKSPFERAFWLNERGEVLAN